ncbi:PREDICTED: glycine-rich selenoprotein [Camelina sativa]|uniref:Glycine-rich selenoprotein n=1 Tax=Camelina sativa TaxID=90675 RepID=A0ABM0UB40_CAMSA|nr:PREDICTED: glycine-rich selenoprotein [Camelina sativa]
MAYVEGGVVKAKRPIWRLRTIKDFFLSIINLIQVFFMTMFSMEKSDAYRKGSKSNKKWDGGMGGGGGGGGGGGSGGGPPRPPRGGLDNVRGLNDIRGADHNSLPACGSCCG